MLLTTSVLKQRVVPTTVFSFHVSVIYTAMLRTSIAAVVLGCFYFCPLDCNASVMVVDCAAVETGCMLEKYMKVFFSVSATTTFLCVYSIAVAAFEKGCMPGKTNNKYYFVFFGGLRCCCSSLMDGDVLKKIRLVSAFCLIRVRNQSRSV